MNSMKRKKFNELEFIIELFTLPRSLCSITCDFNRQHLCFLFLLPLLFSWACILMIYYRSSIMNAVHLKKIYIISLPMKNCIFLSTETDDYWMHTGEKLESVTFASPANNLFIFYGILWCKLNLIVQWWGEENNIRSRYTYLKKRNHGITIKSQTVLTKMMMMRTNKFLKLSRVKELLIA